MLHERAPQVAAVRKMNGLLERKESCQIEKEVEQRHTNLPELQRLSCSVATKKTMSRRDEEF